MGYEASALKPPKASVNDCEVADAAAEAKSQPSPSPWIPMTAATAAGIRKSALDVPSATCIANF